MAILIPSQNIYNYANKKIIDNAISGVELEVNKTKNNTNLKDYFNYSFAKSLDVYTEGQWGMNTPKTDLPENTEYFWTEYKDISQTIYKAWQKFYFEIIPKKYFTNVFLDNLFGNMIFSVSQSRIAGDLKNGEWTKNEGISGNIVSEFTLRDKNASGFTMFSTAIINEEPNSNNIKNIVQQIENDYRSATLSYSYVYFSEISKEKIKGSFLFPVGVDARAADILQTARYSYSSSVVIKMKIGELEEENIVEKIGDNTNFSMQSNELMQSSNTYQSSPYSLVFMQNVIKSYKNGKETATIRCSISDYFSEKYERSEHIDSADKRFKVIQEPPNDRYDAPPNYGIFETKYIIINIVSFDGKSISGDEQIVVEQISETKLKIYFNQAGANIDYVDLRLEVQDAILINNSAGRMSFKLYDQVIPMVYGANGKDRPMATYQNGSPKVFQVLGSKIFYDGAVWQELYLQEA